VIPERRREPHGRRVGAARAAGRIDLRDQLGHGGALGCTQIANNSFCEAGEIVAWNPGTLTAGQSVTVTIPNLYIAHPTADGGELFTLQAIAFGVAMRSILRAREL